jgi:hypothetical protein
VVNSHAGDFRGHARPGRPGRIATIGGVGRVVGDHRHFGRAGEDVDADLTEQRALGLGDELVARAHDHVGRPAAEQPVGHAGDRLHAAEGHDDVGAGGLSKAYSR